jgi:hypothetical protein
MICLVHIQIAIKHVNRVNGQQGCARISAFRYLCSPQTGVEIHAYLLRKRGVGKKRKNWFAEKYRLGNSGLR